jgi:hypothetical protein
MTHNDIIKLAREARLDVKEPSWGYCEVYHFAGYEEPMMRFAHLVAAHEREACAKVVDAYAPVGLNTVLTTVAAAIRARGQA